MTANTSSEQNTEIIGASRYTNLSARVTVMSSLSRSFMASASDWSRPKGPCQFGPGRTCIRATTLRSNQIANSTLVSRKTTMSTAFTIEAQIVSCEKSAATPGAAAARIAWSITPASRIRWHRRVQRQPHEAVDHADGHGDRQVDGAGGLADGDAAAIRHAEALRRGGGQARDRLLGRAGEELLAVLAAARVELEPPRGEHRLTRPDLRRRRLRGARRGHPAARPRLTLRERDAEVRLGGRARLQVGTELLGQHVQHA